MNMLSSLLNFVGNQFGVIELTQTSVSSLPITLTNANILPKHICTSAVLSNPSAQTSDWTVDTDTAGQATISGSISGTTDITIRLELKTN